MFDLAALTQGSLGRLAAPALTPAPRIEPPPAPSQAVTQGLAGLSAEQLLSLLGASTAPAPNNTPSLGSLAGLGGTSLAGSLASSLPGLGASLSGSLAGTAPSNNASSLAALANSGLLQRLQQQQQQQQLPPPPAPAPKTTTDELRAQLERLQQIANLSSSGAAPPPAAAPKTLANILNSAQLPSQTNSNSNGNSSAVSSALNSLMSNHTKTQATATATATANKKRKKPQLKIVLEPTGAKKKSQPEKNVKPPVAAITTATTTTTSSTESGSRRQPQLLYMACDDEDLSQYQTQVRKLIEVFEADKEDTSTSARGRNRPIVSGQVGIRCK